MCDKGSLAQLRHAPDSEYVTVESLGAGIAQVVLKASPGDGAITRLVLAGGGCMEPGGVTRAMAAAPLIRVETKFV